jgi:hypothetical protein
MKRYVFALLLLVAGSVFAQQSSIPEIKFRSVPDSAEASAQPVPGRSLPAWP